MTRKRTYNLGYIPKAIFNERIIIPISDPHEPAASMKDLDGLIVTKRIVRRARIMLCDRALALSYFHLIECRSCRPRMGSRFLRPGCAREKIDGDGRLVMPETLRAGQTDGKILRGKAMRRLDPVIRTRCRYNRRGFIDETVLDAGVMPLGRH